jgi:hypothetical protein
MIKKEELSDPRVGLVYIADDKTVYTKKSAHIMKNDIPSSFYQYVIYSKLNDDRAFFYWNKEEFLKQWLAKKISNRELGQRVSSKLIDELSRVSNELYARETVYSIKHTQEKMQDYEEIKKILEYYGYGYKVGIYPVAAIVSEILEKIKQLRRENI